MICLSTFQRPKYLHSRKRDFTNGKIILVILCLFSPFLILSQSVYFEKYGIEDGLPSSEFYDLIEDHKGYLWFTSDRGVVRYNYNEFETFGIKDGLSNMVNFSFYQDTDSTFWLNGYDGTFTFWDGLQFVPFQFNSQLQEFNKNNFDWYEINRIDPTHIWFVKGNHNSMNQYKISKSTGEVETKKVSKLAYSELCSSKTIRLINFYNACKGLTPQHHSINLESFTYLTREVEELAENDPKHAIINEAIYGDNIWLLTNSGIEVRKYDNLSEKIQDFALDAAISSVRILRNNEIWATSTSDGIIRIPNSAIKLQQLSSKTDKNIVFIQKFWDGMYVKTFDKKLYRIKHDGHASLIANQNPRSIIYSYTKDEETTLYFGNVQLTKNKKLILNYSPGISIPISPKISLFDDYKLINFTSNEDSNSSFLLDHSIKAQVFKFEDNKAYIGGNFGLYQIDFNNYEVGKILQVDTLISGMRINDIIVDNAEIWVGTMGNGILHCIDNQCDPIDVNFRNLSIHSLHQSEVGQLWVGSNKSLVKIDYGTDQSGEKSINKVTSFRTSDGLPSNYIKDLESKNDTLWIGTDNGLAKMSIKNNHKIILSPIIELKEIKFNNRSFPISGERYQVPNDKNDFKIEYVSIASDKPIFQENTYRYKLSKDFSDKTDWVYTKSRVAELANQLPGKYTFTVQSQNSCGMWSMPKEVKYEIRHHFTQTIWFRIGILILIIFLAFLFYKLRTLQLKKRLSLELRLKTSELNILRNQMNPHFIFNSINAIQGYIFSDMKAEANLYIHSLSKLMRKSLKFSRLETITLAEEIDFLNEYMLLEQMRFESLFIFKIVHDNVIDKDKIRIPALVVQPLVENAIKHAFKGMKSGGEILVEFLIEGKVITVSIIDNGIGMDSGKEKKYSEHQSFGLDIVRQRLKLINEKLGTTKAGIQINSNPNEGTKCKMTLPIEKYES